MQTILEKNELKVINALAHIFANHETEAEILNSDHDFEKGHKCARLKGAVKKS